MSALRVNLVVKKTLYLKTRMHIGKCGLNRGELNFGRRKWMVITSFFLFPLLSNIGQIARFRINLLCVLFEDTP